MSGESEDLPELERAAEETRTRIDATLSELERKTGLDAEGSSLESLARSLTQGLWEQAESHPLPVLTVGAGLVWLAVSQTSGGRAKLGEQAKGDHAKGEPAQGDGSGETPGKRATSPEAPPRPDRPKQRPRPRGLDPLTVGAASLAAGIAIGLLAGRFVGRADSGSEPDADEDPFSEENWGG